MRRRGRELLALEGGIDDSVRGAVVAEFPGVDWQLTEQALREWLVCLANRRLRSLALPTRVGQFAWAALNASPEGRLLVSRIDGGPPTLRRTKPVLSTKWSAVLRSISAWDRSLLARERADSVIWGLDYALGIEAPKGIPQESLDEIRNPDIGNNPALKWQTGGGGGF